MSFSGLLIGKAPVPPGLQVTVGMKLCYFIANEVLFSIESVQLFSEFGSLSG